MLSIDFPGEDVADVADRFYQHRFFGVRFNFFPETGDLRIDGAIKGFPASAARQVHQRFAAEYTTWMLGEGGKKVEFACGELNGFACRRNELAACKVQTPALETNHLVSRARCRPRLTPPQNAFDPRQHFAEVKGLGDIVVCPNF